MRLNITRRVSILAIVFVFWGCGDSTSDAGVDGQSDSAEDAENSSDDGQSDGGTDTQDTTSGGDIGTGQEGDAGGVSDGGETPDVEEMPDEGKATGEDTDPEKPDLPAEPPQACTTGNDNCPIGSFCRAAGCENGLEGSCLSFPAACPEIYDPICSCAGVTFDNDCEAYKAGINVDFAGLCEGDELGCELDGLDVCPVGWFCRGDCKGKYLCKCNGPGLCTQKPNNCDDDDDPVCGCDGVTYSNPCEANLNGANVKIKNKCIPKEGAICGGDTGKECLDGQDCNVLGCEEGKAGKCKNYSLLCLGGPQCGCDGKDYENYCKRLEAGVAKKHDGKCTEGGELPYCELAAENNCDFNYYCKSDIGQCEGQGLCTVKPFLCAGWIGLKVCGCDGKSYASPCHAKTANVPIKSNIGPCP